MYISLGTLGLLLFGAWLCFVVLPGLDKRSNDGLSLQRRDEKNRRKNEELWRKHPELKPPELVRWDAMSPEEKRKAEKWAEGMFG